jgi:glycosyltransferase involved in cell wall biosynthesis
MERQNPMTPLRLLAVIEATSITGPAKNLLEFARLAQNELVETTIATFTRGGPNLFTETVRRMNIPLEIIEERKANDPAALRKLDETIRRISPAVLQTHAVKSHFLVRRTGAYREFPWVAFHHGYTWPDLKARLYNQLDRWSLRAARRALTVSGPFRAELIARGVPPGRIEIVHNAIAPNWGAAERQPDCQAETRRAWGIPADRKIILIVGRLSREKDHLTLLAATKRTQAVLPVHLVIVGAGPERPRIEERIRELGLQNQVTLTGQQKSAAPFYGIADIAVLSSLSEGSPNALLEALASGVPVVATRVGGIPEIVNDGETALLVPPSYVNVMTSAMCAILRDAALSSALAARGRSLIAERHSPELRARKLCEIYRSMARSDSPALVESDSRFRRQNQS